jgi:pimeloyl-ACP methyl ester carboxylesterase
LAIRQLRQLARSDYNLVSFSYAGHGRSTPPFSLQASLRDTDYMFDLAARDSRSARLPLFGVGLCYGSIPMLSAAHKACPGIRGIVLINALPRLFSFNLVRSIADEYRSIRRVEMEKDYFRRMWQRYIDRLLPQIDKGFSKFGALKRHHIRLWKTLWEAITRNPLRTVRLEHTPVLSIYSPDDPLLGAYRLFHDDGAYERCIRRICPRATFVVLKGDHFLSSREDRGLARQAILRFLEQTVSA